MTTMVTLSLSPHVGEGYRFTSPHPRRTNTDIAFIEKEESA